VQAQQVLEFWPFDEPDSVVEREAAAIVAEPRNQAVVTKMA
jgi:hypothetical protein